MPAPATSCRTTPHSPADSVECGACWPATGRCRESTGERDQTGWVRGAASWCLLPYEPPRYSQIAIAAGESLPYSAKLCTAVRRSVGRMTTPHARHRVDEVVTA